MYDFPNSPTTGQIATGPGGIQWSWDGAKWVVVNQSSPGFAPINSPVFTGNPTAPTPPYGDNSQSLSNTSFVQSAVTPLSHNVGRNLLHNGLFNISQRGAGPFTGTPYTADRWRMYEQNDTFTTNIVVLADADRVQLGDDAATWTLQGAFVGSATAGSFSYYFQPIESQRRFANKTVTLSFYARATSGTPKIGIGYRQNFGSGGSPSADVYGNFGVTPALTSTFQRYSFTGTYPSLAGKTFGTTQYTDFAQIEFWLSDQGANSARSGGIGVQSGTVQFWGMQLEIGPTATPLEKLDPRMDLANCQRFYQTGSISIDANATGASAVYGYTYSFAVVMRATPTITPTFTTQTNCTGGSSAASLTPFGWHPYLTATASGQCYASGGFTASADL